MNRFAPNMKITSLALAERAPYATQYRREFVTRGTPETFEAPHDGFIKYSADARPSTPLPNGWDTGRFAFVLQGETKPLVGGKLTFQIQGYTSHLGASKDGGFDPDMDFFINSISLHRHITELTPTGERDHVMSIQSSQVLVEPAWRGAYIDEARMTKVRPEDIFAIMQRSQLISGFGGSELVDLRTILSSTPVAGARRHLIPSQLLNDVLSGYKRAQLDLSFALRDDEILDHARGYVQEPIVRNHPFFRALANVRDGLMTNMFSWKDLMYLDEHVADVTTISTISPGAPARPDYASWLSNDLVTVSAWTVAQSVRALMDMFGMQQVKFSATNLISAEERLADPTLQHDVAIGAYASRDYDDVAPLLIASFRSRLEQLVLSDISMRGQLAYRMYVDANVFGDTKVEIALDGGERISYCVPAFADALYSPLVMTGDGSLLAADMEALIHHQAESLHTGLQAIAGRPTTFGTL